MSKYEHLHSAHLGRQYLHTNSTTHEFLFGALAELVDNARDANANELNINTDQFDNVRGDYTLSFLDDGDGMTPEEVKNVVMFGSSYKKTNDINLIGQYGNGLKSGSMRIGKDLILFTKKDSVKTILFLSRTFLESENIDNILVPMPSFDADNFTPIFNSTEDREVAKQRHKREVEAIREFSPFKNDTALNEQFDKIHGSSGTLVMIYNLKLGDDGSTELDFLADPYDIQMPDQRVDYDTKSQLEHKSFRAYVSILYTNPRMKIYINGKKVRTKLLDRTLFNPFMYKYASTRFKARNDAEIKESEVRIKLFKERLRECKSNILDFEKRFNKKKQEDHTEMTKRKRVSEKAEADLKNEEVKLARLKKSLHEQKSLHFIFGMNIHNRSADGIFIYNCNRLILMYEHTKNYKNNKNYKGIVGIVNVPYLVLEPTHNKQAFADNKEQQMLLAAIGEHMEQYFKDLNEVVAINDDFWRQYGYEHLNHNFLPNDEEVFKRKRLQNTSMMVQCDKCLKWRLIAWHRRNILDTFPAEEWECQNNTEIGKDSCRSSEHLEDIKIKELRKQVQYVNDSFSRSSASNTSRQFSLLQKEKDVVIDKAVPPSERDRNSQLLQKKRILSQVDVSSDSESDQGTRANNRAEKAKDPDFRLNGNNSSKKIKKKTPAYVSESDNNSSAISQNETIENSSLNRASNIYENYIIDREIIEPLVRVKTEPFAASRFFEGQDHSLRYSLESGVEINTVNDRQVFNFSPKVVNSCREDALQALIQNQRTLLQLLASTMNDHELTRSITSMNEIELAHYSVTEFMNNFNDSILKDQKKKERILKMSMRKKTREVLSKFMDESKVNEAIDTIYNMPSPSSSTASISMLLGSKK